MPTAQQDPVARILDHIIRGLVDEPEAVEIERIPTGSVDTYQVRVSPHDLGKVIGKHGRVASAVRLVARAVSMKCHRKVQVDIDA